LLFAAPFCVVILSAFYFLRVARGEPAPRKKSAAQNASSSVNAKPSLQPQRATDEFAETRRVITQRNLFRPIVEKRRRPSVQRTVSNYVPPAPRFERVTALPRLAPMPINRVQPLPPVRSSQQPSQKPASPTGGVTVVGTVSVNGVLHGVVEDTVQGETRFIRVGEEAFGFRLARLDDERAVLERGGRTFTLSLGAHKEDKPLRPPTPSQPPNTAENAAAADALARLRNAEVLLQEQVQSQGGTQDVQPQQK
jgi:hypothetical protein